MNTPLHMLKLTGSITPASYSPTIGVDQPSYSSATAVPCHVDEDGSRRALEDQRLSGTWTATGYFPWTHGGSAVSLPKDCIVSVSGDGFTTKAYRVVGPARNQAGRGVLQIVAMEATT